MRFDLGDLDFKEQAELMNMLNNFSENNQMQNNASMGFNNDSIYNIIDMNNDKK